jgi:16S rRNA (adenine(1408)-N(1))-methyltransferase
MAAADRVLVDLGTGDGRAAVGLAGREPTAFILGLDATAAAMAESSLRAARSVAKGGLPNLLFAVAAAERPPVELCGRADEVSILFPWGSLLRGALALDPAAAAGIVALLAPGGRVEAIVSVAPKDIAASDLRPLAATDREAIAGRWSAHGLTLAAFASATSADIDASGSTWAKRLLAGRQSTSPSSAIGRAVWRLELVRDPGRLHDPG